MAIFNSYVKLPEGICHRDHSENMNPRPIRKKKIAKSQYALQGAVGPLVDENGAAMLLFGRLKTLTLW